MEPRNRCQGINSASLFSLAGRYENPIPPQCLAPIDFLKIPALVVMLQLYLDLIYKIIHTFPPPPPPIFIIVYERANSDTDVPSIPQGN
jgi:hypothetical protein